MVTPDFEKSWDASIDQKSFSNGSQLEEFVYNQCSNCVHEVECALIDIAFLGRTPVEWTPAAGSYRCSSKQPSQVYL